MSKISEDEYIKTVSEVRNVAVSFDKSLDSGEQFTGTPTVTEVTSSDLTLDNKAVSTGSLSIKDKTVTVGRAIQFRVASGSAGTRYTVAIQCGTNSTPAQTIRGYVLIRVVAD